MKFDSASHTPINALLGVMAALGAAATALPAAAATVTINAAAATASGVITLNTSSVKLVCKMQLSLGLAPGAATAVAYTIPPATVLLNVTAASFSSGSAGCVNLVATGLPWGVLFTAVTDANTVNVTFNNLGFSSPLIGNCGQANMPGSYSSMANNFTLPPFLIVRSPQCFTSQPVTLTVTAPVSPYLTMTSP